MQTWRTKKIIHWRWGEDHKSDDRKVLKTARNLEDVSIFLTSGKQGASFKDLNKYIERWTPETEKQVASFKDMNKNIK